MSTSKSITVARGSSKRALLLLPWGPDRGPDRDNFHVTSRYLTSHHLSDVAAIPVLFPMHSPGRMIGTHAADEVNVLARNLGPADLLGSRLPVPVELTRKLRFLPLTVPPNDGRSRV